MTELAKPGRANQRLRTRKDLLQAAARLMKQGRSPTLEEVAAEAMVSRATAYRYFPSVESLLAEASADLATPRAEDLFAAGLPDDPVSRVQRVESAFHEMTWTNEPALRVMLARSIEAGVGGSIDGEVPRRQNRRMPLIEAALAPSRKQIRRPTFDKLRHSLAMIIGTESMIVFKDVLQLDAAAARAAKQWAVRALVEAALRE